MSEKWERRLLAIALLAVIGFLGYEVSRLDRRLTAVEGTPTLNGNAMDVASRALSVLRAGSLEWISFGSSGGTHQSP